MAEIVYVLTNEAMDGLVKIGRTTTSVEQRIKELDNTSIPLPFQCFFAGEVADCAYVEAHLHKAFADKRVRNNREFFRVDANQVRAYVTRTGLSGHTRNSITDLAKLESELNHVRRVGNARDDEELELGVSCLAAAILDDTGKLVADYR